MTLPDLVLKKREEKRLLAGHLWVYSNEVDTQKSPLKNFASGDCVNLVSASGRQLGSAYVNPNSLICARKFHDKPNKTLGMDLVRKRIQTALNWREKLYEGPFYRLIYSEGDLLPGLIVDRYDDCLVLQYNTAGIDKLSQEILTVLDDLFAPQRLILRNDSPSRERENLETMIGIAKGDESPLAFCEENGASFQVDVIQGQKTGWFYDQRLNRKNAVQYAENRSVLDVFSYTGSWSVTLAKQGACAVTAIDVSQQALDKLVINAELNETEDKIQTHCADAFDAMRELKQNGESYDVVVIDPPAFIKRRKDFKEGLQAYQRAYRLAMSLVSPGGLLIASSCSYHLSRENLQNSLLKASRKLERPMQIVQYGGQGPDHPVHPAIEETAYLKTVFARIL